MPIRYIDLLTKVKEGTLTEREATLCFLPAASAAPSFTPTFIINEHEVDITGIERTARASATQLAYQAGVTMRQRSDTRVSAARAKNILAEGDSWFNLPIAGATPPTMIDILGATRPINNIAHPGDTLAEIMLASQYVPLLIGGTIDYFLFSAGGNDALGGGKLASFLRQRVSGDNDPRNASLYIRPTYYAMAENVEAAYRALLTNVRNISPNTVILIHGYDYCVPRRNGNWLGEPLRFRGFDPLDQRDLARAIVRVLVNDFNVRLARLAQSIVNVEYVDLRKTLDEDEWWDELHPDRQGAEKFAALIGARLDAVSGGTRRTGNAPRGRAGRAATNRRRRSRRDR